VATTIDSLRQLDAWQALARHADETRDLRLRDELGHDSSTNALIRRYRRARHGTVPKEA
jgi:hypothetical protein